jgi:hypothetical protein
VVEGVTAAEKTEEPHTQNRRVGHPAKNQKKRDSSHKRRVMGRNPHSADSVRNDPMKVSSCPMKLRKADPSLRSG